MEVFATIRTEEVTTQQELALTQVDLMQIIVREELHAIGIAEVLGTGALGPTDIVKQADTIVFLEENNAAVEAVSLSREQRQKVFFSPF
jgi:hypothetical protein